MEVFVSWRGADRELKNKVVSALKEGLPADVEIWESDGGCASRSLEECAEAVGRCQVFVIIVSDETLKPSYVDSELTLAHEREMSGECNMIMYRTTDKALTGFLSMHLCNTFDANHVSRLAGTNDGISVLVERVKRMLELREGGTPERPFDVHMPEFSGGELGENFDFLEGSRDGVLPEIDRAFLSSNTVFICRSAGYGKRTLAREYKRLHKDDYKSTPYLHLFKGSLCTLLLDGIEFKNVNPAYFAQDNDNKTIQKKTDLLKKLNTDTLLIVPGVRPDAKTDNDTVLDAIASVGCRMLLLTEWVPANIRERFPVIDLPDLPKKSLRELFYTSMNIDEYDRTEELDTSLDSFFSRIGNNILAIKLTASTLNDEIGLYPEDIPERLDSMIMGEWDNELDSVLSSLYDLEGHTPEEQAILYVAALCAEIPLDERDFSELLSELEIDPKVLRPLCEDGWLIRDTATRTISIDPLLAAVSFTKFSAPATEESINEAVFCFLKNRKDSYAVTVNTLGYLSYSKRLELFFRRLNVDCFAVLCSLSPSALSGEGSSKEMLEDLKAECEAYVASPANIFYDIDEELYELIEDESASVKLSLINEELAERPRNVDITSSIASLMFGNEFFTGMLNTLKEFDCEIFDECVREDIRNLFAAMKNGNLFELSECVVRLSENLDTARLDDVAFIILGQGVTTAILLYMFASKFSETLALSARKIYDNMPRGFESVQLIGYLYLFNCYYSFNVCDSRAEDALMKVIALSQKPLSAFFKETIKFDGWNEADTIARLRISFGDSDGAISLFRRVDKAVKGKRLTKNRLLLVQKIVTALIDEARLGEAKSFLVSAIETKEKGCDLEAAEILEELNEALRLLSANGNEECEGREDYKGYYESYANSVDRKLNAKYNSLAAISEEIDLSHISKEELVEKTKELRARAQSEVREAIIPEALALISEAGARTLGYRHHHTQLMGALAIFEGHIAELQNGEGKTYVIATAAFLHYIFGTPVTVIDKSLYLTARNYNWMRGTLSYLGVSVGLLDKSKKREIKAESHDVIYAFFNAAVFEQLYKELGYKGYNYEPSPRAAIVDEADDLMITNLNMSLSVLSDSDNGRLSAVQLEKMYNIVKALPAYAEDYFTSNGYVINIKDVLLHSTLQALDFSAPDFNDISMVENALKITIGALRLWQRDKDYYVIKGKVWYEESSTGILQEYSGVHAYALAKKEGLEIPLKEFRYTNSWINSTTTYQHLMLYSSVAGATATAVAVKVQFESFYNKRVVSIPTHSPVMRIANSPLLFRLASDRDRYVIETAIERNKADQPVMIICSGIPEARKFSAMLKDEGVEHSLLTGEAALGSEREDAKILGSAGRLGAVTVCTAVANRGVDIVLGGDPLRATVKHLERLGYKEEEITSALYTSGDCNETAAVREKAESLLAYYRASYEEEKRQVLSLGGLCVIGTECFPALSTEQQVIGRCARQGAPGESFMFFSLEDSSLCSLLGANASVISSIFKKLGIDEIDISSGGIVNVAKMLKKAREKWQKASLNHKLDSVPEKFYPQVKRELFGTRDLLLSNQLDLFDFIEDTLSGDGQLVAELRSLDEGGAVFGGRLDELLRENKIPSKNKVGNLVADCYRSLFESGEFPKSAKNSVVKFVGNELSRSFEKYLKTINEFINKTSFLRSSGAKALSDLAEKESGAVVLELKREIIKRLLRSKIRIRTDNQTAL